MGADLPDFVAARLRSARPAQHVVAGSTPVISFGDPSRAAAATLGLNPSWIEFLQRDRTPLDDRERRLETMTSLGVEDLSSAPDAVLARIAETCNAYFGRNPYRRWFDQLEPMLRSVGASYYDGTACHLDLVQWATDRRWGEVPSPARDRLIAADAGFLRSQLRHSPLRFLLINGRGVLDPFLSVTGTEMRSVDGVDGASVWQGRLNGATHVIAWSVNVQSSFGVSKRLRADLARRVAELARGGGSARAPTG